MDGTLAFAQVHYRTPGNRSRNLLQETALQKPGDVPKHREVSRRQDWSRFPLATTRCRLIVCVMARTRRNGVRIVSTLNSTVMPFAFILGRPARPMVGGLSRHAVPTQLPKVHRMAGGWERSPAIRRNSSRERLRRCAPSWEQRWQAESAGERAKGHLCRLAYSGTPGYRRPSM